MSYFNPLDWTVIAETLDNGLQVTVQHPTHPEETTQVWQINDPEAIEEVRSELRRYTLVPTSNAAIAYTTLSFSKLMEHLSPLLSGVSL